MWLDKHEEGGYQGGSDSNGNGSRRGWTSAGKRCESEGGEEEAEARSSSGWIRDCGSRTSNGKGVGGAAC